MAVREGGRELLVNLRPPDLGHLTIRVTMTDGVLQAQIIADRPEAARMLQQSLAQLDSALTDLGYSLDGLDVSLRRTGRAGRAVLVAGHGRHGPPEAGDDIEAAATAAASSTTAPSLVVAARPARVRRDHG